jgi:hypothetical protein
MKTPLFPAVVCLTLVATSFAIGLNAGDQPQAAPLPPGYTAQGVPTPPGYAATPHYDLEIVNGVLHLDPALSKHYHNAASVPATLTTVVDVLRVMHEGANLVLSPNLADITISDLKVKGLPLEDELEALRVACGDRFLWMHGAPSLRPAALDPATGLPVTSPPPGGDFYSLVPNRDATSVRSNLEVFNLGPFLKQEKDAKQRDEAVAQLNNIIQSAIGFANLDQSGGETTLRCQFYPGAQLLIVTGGPDVLEVARKVVRAATGEPVPEPGMMRSSGFGGGGGMMGGMGPMPGMGGMGGMGGGMSGMGGMGRGMMGGGGGGMGGFGGGGGGAVGPGGAASSGNSPKPAEPAPRP